MPIKSFRDLVAWQEAHALAHLAYDVADGLPEYEQHAPASQVRRAATSVHGNIAEGFCTGTRPKFLNHLRMARGSLTELESCLQFVSDRRSAPIPDNLDEQRVQAGRVLQALITSLERSQRPGPGGKKHRPPNTDH